MANTIALSQNDSIIKLNEFNRISGDTIFIFSGEQLFLNVKIKKQRVYKISIAKPIYYSTKTLILNFKVLSGNSCIATFYNPFTKNLHFSVSIMKESDQIFITKPELYAPAKGFAPLAWEGKANCLKIFNLYFK